MNHLLDQKTGNFIYSVLCLERLRFGLFKILYVSSFLSHFDTLMRQKIINFQFQFKIYFNFISFRANLRVLY